MLLLLLLVMVMLLLLLVMVMMLKHHWRILPADIPNYCWDYSHSLNTCMHSISNVRFAHFLNRQIEKKKKLQHIFCGDLVTVKRKVQSEPQCTMCQAQ